MKIEKIKKQLWHYLFLIILPILICNDASGSTRNVPSQYVTIQAGIDAAVNGDTVLVADGVYTGQGNYNIDFKGKKIILKSQNGNANCIIDPQQQGRGIFFRTNEGPETQLDGFTIRNAIAANITASDNGAGIYCEGASPTISNCIIKNNYSTGNGAGIFFSDSSSTVTNCVISDNNAAKWGYGGGIYSIGSTVGGFQISLINCQILRNKSGGWGGGISARRIFMIIKQCKVNGNTSQSGGGIYSFDNGELTMSNSIVANNATTGEGMGRGGGLYLDGSGIITNCTIYGNTSAYGGGGIYFDVYGNSEPAITNSIIWNNAPDEVSIAEDTPGLIPKFRFCNIKGGYNGESNFHADPLFINPSSENFHLSVQSPCVDRGTSENSPDTDIEGNPRPQGAGVDVGAYELTGYANTRPRINFFTITPHHVSFPMEIYFTCAAIDPDGSIISYTIDYGDGSPSETNTTGLFTHIYSSPDAYATCTVTDSSGITVKTISLTPFYNGIIYVPADYQTIQAAIDAAADKSNTTIIVADGIYKGEGNRDISFKGKAITVKSQNGPMHTIINCERSGRGFIFSNKEGRDSILNGFTISYGTSPTEPSSTFEGGGILCGYSPIIENCIIKYNEGGGICIGGSPLIRNYIITDNKSDNGGGLKIAGGTPVIFSCVISNNFAFSPGADPQVAGGGGIACLFSAAPKIINCTITNNITVASGGAIHGGAGAYSVINCTLSGNVSLSDMGGGIFHYSSNAFYGPPTFKNCILWGNLPDEIFVGTSRSGVRSATEPVVLFSDIQGGYAGEGNISQDPLFIDPAGDNYKLGINSPCIDTGTSSMAPETDIEGTNRPLISGYDMGAFEAKAYDPSQPEIDSFSSNVTEGGRPLQVTFTCTAHDPDGVVSSYSIDYGDGSSIESNTTGLFHHTYNSGGRSYAVCTVTDDDV